MSRCRRSPRFALWAVVCALCLKVFVPLLAASASQIRGVPVAEVCTVYGVAPAGGSSENRRADPWSHDDRGSHSAAAHSVDHCALTALAALAPANEPTTDVRPARTGVSAEFAPAASVTRRDACAAWAAQLEHGPPPFG